MAHANYRHPRAMRRSDGLRGPRNRHLHYAGDRQRTLVATIPGGKDATEAPASVQLHAGGAQVITAHADGTKSVRSIGVAPVELGDSSDVVALEFYASGVRDGAEIHVQIAGQEVPVLYAGPAGHFAGLDQVSVRFPAAWPEAEMWTWH